MRQLIILAPNNIGQIKLSNCAALKNKMMTLESTNTLKVADNH